MKKAFVVLVAAWLFSCGEEKKTTETLPPVKNSDTAQKQPDLLQPPFAGTDIPFQEIMVDADSGRTFTAANGYGTAVHVPGGIFIDSAGNRLTGKIRLRFRELHTPADMLVAGIPMNYDAAGMLKRFNTAGMVELRADQAGKNVFLDSAKVITVNMASFEAGSAYHAFYLDEQLTRDWEYIKDLEGVENAEKKKLIRKARAKVTAFDIPFNGEYFAFNYMALLDVYLHDKTVEIKKNRTDLTLQGKIKEYGVTWTNIYCYQSIDFNGQKTLASLLLWKKLNKEPWPLWMNGANCNITDNGNGTCTLELVQTKGKGLYKAVIKPFYPIKSLLAFSPSYWKNRYNLAVRKAIAAEMSKVKTADVFRALEVHRLGVYAAARLQREEDYVQVALDPDIKVTEKINEVYYVSELYRTVLRFPAGQWQQVVLLPDAGARLFVVLESGAMMVVPEENMRQIDFRALKSAPGTVLTLPFREVQGRGKGAAEWARLLGLSEAPV